MFYSVGIFRTSSPGDRVSSIPERTAPQEVRGGASLYRSVATKAGSLNIKR